MKQFWRRLHNIVQQRRFIRPLSDLPNWRPPNSSSNGYRFTAASVAVAGVSAALYRAMVIVPKLHDDHNESYEGLF